MNLLAEVKKGLKGLNQGLHFYSTKMNRYLGGIHPFYYVVAAAAKAGKTSFVDQNVIIGPYLAKEHEGIEWHYFSTEISRVAKEAKIIACLAFIKHSVKLDADLILGRKRDHTGSPLLMNAVQQKMVEEIYHQDIIPLFGEFDPATGKQITPGRIKFYPGRYTPSEIREIIFAVARANGTFSTTKINVIDPKGKTVEKEIVTGYTPTNSKRIIIIVDHMRGIKREPNLDRKTNIDKLSEHFVDIRDWFKFSIFGVIHLNRSITNIERIKLHRETLYPTDEDLKDSGNPVEDFLGEFLASLTSLLYLC